MSQTTEPTIEQWKSLYNLSTKFRKLACWQWMTDEEVLGVQNPATGEIGYCCIIGNLGQQLGIIVYQGTEGFSSYQRLLRGNSSSDAFDDFLAQKCLSVTFNDKSVLEQEDLSVINALALTFHGTKAYPCFRNLTPGYFPWFLSAGDVDFLCLVLDQAMNVCVRCKESMDILKSRTPGHYLVRVKKPGDEKNQWTDEWLKPDPIQPNPIERCAIDESRVMRLTSNAKKSGIWEFSYALWRTCR